MRLHTRQRYSVLYTPAPVPCRRHFPQLMLFSESVALTGTLLLLIHFISHRSIFI